MATVNLPVDDGSLLALVGVATDERPDCDEQAPILGPVSDFLADWSKIGEPSFAAFRIVGRQWEPLDP